MLVLHNNVYIKADYRLIMRGGKSFGLDRLLWDASNHICKTVEEKFPQFILIVVLKHKIFSYLV